MLIPDFDNGMVVKAFTFEVDLRVGNPVGNDGRPADGFSVNYARANDPVVLDLNQEPPVVNWNNYAIPGAPEGGTTTGLSICFDTWSGNTWPSGETDLEGIIVRVDNTTVARVPMATRNGACTDATSLQTGPYNPDLNGAPDELCWAPLKVELAENGELTVTWKGTVIVDKVQTGFSPSAGRLVFAGRTGGANENTHIDNLRVTTVPADNLVIGLASGTPTGFTITVSDSGPAVFNPGAAGAIVDFKLNGQSITPTRTSKTGGLTTLAYANAAAPIPPGSANTVSLTVRDTRGLTVSKEVTFTGIAYTTLDPAWAATGVNTAQPGFTLRMYQVDFTDERGVSRASDNANSGVSIASGERMLHGDLGPNTADLTRFTGPGGTYRESMVINYNAATGNIGNFTDDGWYGGAPAPNMPGIPGSATLEGGNANYALEIRTVLDLQPGTYHMGVNSDDGFRLIVGDGKEAYTLPVICGEFSGGRGADNWGFTRFSIKVTQAGLYPFRMVFEQGGGGHNVEWFQILEDGRPDQLGKVLINVDDPITGARAIRAYQYPVNATGPTWVKSFAPGRSSLGSAGSRGRAGPDATVKAVLVDGSTPVDPASVSLRINGAAVTPTVTKTGDETSVTYKPEAGFAPGSTNEVALTFGDRTVSWSFIVNLPATPTFWIEAADFDHDGGQSRPEASVMPYAGGAYAGLSAVAGTDYKGFNTPDNPYYRYPNSLGVPMSFANDRDRGGSEVIVNFRPGWMGSAQWFNYTRNVPPGKYHIYAALSHGDANASIGGNLANVSGGTENVLGVFDGLAPGGWGNNALLPLKDAATTNQVVALDLGGTQTFRYNDRNGDWDFLLFVPATEPGGELRIDSIVKNANGTITVTWSGGGTLQAAPTVLGPWQDVTGATSPYTFTPSEQMLFGRIRR